MQAILDGRGRADAFVPAPGLKEFLLALKERGIKIALVTSGLHEKAWPEIVAAFRALKHGRPARLLRCDHHRRVSAAPGRGRHAGRAVAQAAPLALRRGRARRSGHPVRGAQLGAGHRGFSGAGVCAIRLAGFPTVGMAGGNIIESGTRALCDYYCETFAQVLQVLDEPGAGPQILVSTDAIASLARPLRPTGSEQLPFGVVGRFIGDSLRSCRRVPVPVLPASPTPDNAPPCSACSPTRPRPPGSRCGRRAAGRSARRSAASAGRSAGSPSPGGGVHSARG